MLITSTAPSASPAEKLEVCKKLSGVLANWSPTEKDEVINRATAGLSKADRFAANNALHRILHRILPKVFVYMIQPPLLVSGVFVLLYPFALYAGVPTEVILAASLFFWFCYDLDYRYVFSF